MTVPVPTAAQIRAQVTAVLGKASRSRVVGIRSPAAVDLGGPLLVDGREIPIAWCGSVLEMRERLAGTAVEDGPLVLLTPLPEPELGADVVARLAKHHLFSIEPWLVVRERFQARHVDPRLVERHHWVARVLLEAEPPGGYAPAPSGFLEAEQVWRVLFEALLGLPGGARDPEALLEWSAEDAARQRMRQIDDDARDGLAAAVEDSAGVLARRIFDCATGPKGSRALAAGLVARVLFGPDAKGDQSAAKASGHLEAWLGGGELTSTLALGWAEAAEAVVRRSLASGGIKVAARLLDQADELLEELGAGHAAHRSDLLKAGYEQRLESFGERLQAFAKGKAKQIPSALSEAAGIVQRHVLAEYHTERKRAQRVGMALRLARWLATQRADSSPAAGSLAAAASAYRRAGGHVDWARGRIWDSESLPALSGGYTALLAAARRLRETENRRFGELLANWSRTGSHDKSLTPVEEVLNRVVAPLAAAQPVLVVVLDGMGMAVFRELESDLVNQGWTELDLVANSMRLPVISALPTVTETSRASLLAGKLVVGQSANEKEAFSSHTGLVAASEPTRPPALYHKGDLTEAGVVGVPAAIFRSIDDLHRRVVGVVINAVDDHLAKGDQLRIEWRAHTIRPLEELLSAARAVGRAVIIVSDHGHIPEHDTASQGESASAERWREATSKPGEGEVLLEGPRVLLGGGRVVAPWSESVRLGMKKNGYHGGAAPQEVVIPLGVFIGGGLTPDGWSEVGVEHPVWWDGAPDISEVAAPVSPPPESAPSRPKPADKQGSLFPAEGGSPATEQVTAPEWIERLLASDVMVAQRRAAARTHLDDARIRTILVALDERGGKLTRPALAKRLGVPVMRVGGIISALRRVLNVEGYDVLAVDEASDTVVLNREYLDVQFGL